ncbi:MAG: 4-hydroxythreonine-4-phosphate dehydrogenase PdxA [Candidatus Cloacimonetes bacterium]|jgi:4-hydroxythreonine-4-phosphate dehydrogenase|nr:4-hydroxythreonine-4-phosphate dehydrogenase PdxA [Candidatus Cloacimonadota bacterium]MBT6994813.1 4-hydroxythreonine-4-phosphate dehydrogenase PdxA [Candidatus Cloacimonadota bacterium]MBT7470185.1 4-hydroxythreonine-4-phosphate dehydrogenase PdxA [Candidatus Cloacimonadota bacterium]
MNIIAITTGDPAGIGPEITTKMIRFLPLNDENIYVVYGKLFPFADGNNVIEILKISEAISPHNIYWIKIDEDIEIGKPTKKSGKISHKILQKCSEDLMAKKIDAVVTCPISKEAIQETYPDFVGHTEFFAQISKSEKVIMSFWGPHFNLALLTTHLPISQISANMQNIEAKLRLIYVESHKILSNPKIAILGINPHAGENGKFGKDDVQMEQVLAKLKKENIAIDGPFPADTFFATKQYDVVISAYHDQGLIPFKMISHESGVNVTLGLPFVRTSVDHGTAFDIAGKGVASEKSLVKAIKFAQFLLSSKKQIGAENYSFLAEYYDEYMSEVPYDEWAEFVVQKYIELRGQNPQNVLELACGTAEISTRLVRKGLAVDAVDSSREMLNIAAQKTDCPKLYNHKITEKFTKKGYDLALLIFDSFNYLTQKTEVQKMLENVHEMLHPNGLFIFDISTVQNCRENIDGFINIFDKKDVYFVHESDFLEDEKIQETHFTFFRKKGYQFTKKVELHRQKIYDVSEILEMTQKFKIKGIYSVGKPENLIEKSSQYLDENFGRLFFVLEK